MSTDVPLVAVVVEPNPLLRRRVGRVVGAGVGLGQVAELEKAADVGSVIDARPAVVLCGAEEARGLFGLLSEALPFTQLVVWSQRSSRSLLRAALEQPRLSHLIGWPSFASMPRPWELLMAVRRLTDPQAARPAMRELLGWGGTFQTWSAATGTDRDRVVTLATSWAERAGAHPRMAERVAGVAHELLMNAMYGAPTDTAGRPLYAHDRRQEVALPPADAPRLTLGTDGSLLTLEVEDPFGGLERQRLIGAIVRALDGSESGTDELERVVDTSHGGAGLGLLRIYSAGAALIVDVEPGRRTRVSSIFDLELAPRDLRGLPPSLHYFEA